MSEVRDTEGILMVSDAHIGRETDEEYTIVEEATPSSKPNFLLLRRKAMADPKGTVASLGISEGRYELAKLDGPGRLMLNSVIRTLPDNDPRLCELRIIEERATAHSRKGIMRPSKARKIMADRPDLGVIAFCNGLLVAIATIRQYSDIHIQPHGSRPSIFTEDDTIVLKDMVAYRNLVATEIHVPRPDSDRTEDWIKLYLRVMSVMYAAATTERSRSTYIQTD